MSRSMWMSQWKSQEVANSSVHTVYLCRSIFILTIWRFCLKVNTSAISKSKVINQKRCPLVMGENIQLLSENIKFYYMTYMRHHNMISIYPSCNGREWIGPISWPMQWTVYSDKPILVATIQALDSWRVRPYESLCINILLYDDTFFQKKNQLGILTKSDRCALSIKMGMYVQTTTGSEGVQ